MTDSDEAIFKYLLSLGEDKIKDIGTQNIVLLGALYGNDFEKYKESVEQIIETGKTGFVNN